MISQADSSQASPEDSTLSQAESEISQAGSSQASPEDSTLPQAESVVFPQAVRQSARLRPLQGSNNPQAGNTPNNSSRQAGNTPRVDSASSQFNSNVAQAVSSQASTSQEARSSPSRHNSPQGSSPLEEPNPKWVINLSSKPLTKAQRSVLAKDPNFVVSPKHPPNLEYITAIEAACTKLSQQDAEELRANVNWTLRASHPPKPNLTKAQNLAIRELKKDRDCIVLTADKGVEMVIMDRQEYISKANNLLSQNTYRSIQWDPINTIKNKLINILKRVKSQTGLNNQTYKAMYPTGCVPPKFYGLPKIHKLDTPLRPIVSSCGSVTYGVAKELAKILKPLVGKSPHHINSTQDFVEQVRHITLVPGECLSSYDVSALFTSVPIDPALKIIKDLLVKDPTLKDRTVIGVDDIILLLEFCLKNTYFSSKASSLNRLRVQPWVPW